jgi:hypothetical protein
MSAEAATSARAGPAPQLEGLTKQIGGPGRVATGQGLAALTVEALEAVQVEALRVDPEQVAGVAW